MTDQELATLNKASAQDKKDAVLLTCRQHDNIMQHIKDGEELAQKLRKDHAIEMDALKAEHEEALAAKDKAHGEELAEYKAIISALGDHPTVVQMAKDARKAALQAELAKLG